jgi:hypothetical protein
MNFRYIAPMFLIGALAISGCNDPKKASEANFKTAAQQFLDSAYPTCYFEAKFPYKTDGFSINNTPDILHVLAQKGLLTEKELSRKHYDATWAMGAHDVVANSYDLTDEGKKYYKVDASKNLIGKPVSGFCFGKATVSAVVNFTEPSDMMGQKISRVTYSYKVTDIPDWAKSPEITALSSKLANDVNSEKDPQKITNVFLLTNNGWIHEKLFGK